MDPDILPEIQPRKKDNHVLQKFLDTIRLLLTAMSRCAIPEGPLCTECIFGHHMLSLALFNVGSQPFLPVASTTCRDMFEMMHRRARDAILNTSCFYQPSEIPNPFEDVHVDHMQNMPLAMFILRLNLLWEDAIDDLHRPLCSEGHERLVSRIIDLEILCLSHRFLEHICVPFHRSHYQKMDTILLRDNVLQQFHLISHQLKSLLN